MLDAQKLILVASLLTATVTHATCSSECVPPRKKFAEDHCACADDFPIRAPATAGTSLKMCSEVQFGGADSPKAQCPGTAAAPATGCMSKVGDAVADGDWTVLTQGDPNGKNQVGGSWSTDTYNISEGFHAAFKFKVEDWTCDDLTCGGDGFAFVLTRAGRGSTGAARSGLGYSGMPYSLAIEFDTYSDSFEQDLVPPYVNVHLSPMEETGSEKSNPQESPATVYRNWYLKDYDAKDGLSPKCVENNQVCDRSENQRELEMTNPGGTYPRGQIITSLPESVKTIKPAPKTGQSSLLSKPGVRFAECPAENSLLTFNFAKNAAGQEKCCMWHSERVEDNHCNSGEAMLAGTCAQTQCLNGMNGTYDDGQLTVATTNQDNSEQLSFLPLKKSESTTSSIYHYYGRSQSCATRTQAPFFIDAQEHTVEIAYKDSTLKVYMGGKDSEPLVTVRCLDLASILRGTGDVRVGFTASTSTAVVQKNSVKEFVFKTSVEHSWNTSLSLCEGDGRDAPVATGTTPPARSPTTINQQKMFFLNPSPTREKFCTSAADADVVDPARPDVISQWAKTSAMSASVEITDGLWSQQTAANVALCKNISLADCGSTTSTPTCKSGQSVALALQLRDKNGVNCAYAPWLNMGANDLATSALSGLAPSNPSATATSDLYSTMPFNSRAASSFMQSMYKKNDLAGMTKGPIWQMYVHLESAPTKQLSSFKVSLKSVATPDMSAKVTFVSADTYFESSDMSSVVDIRNTTMPQWVSLEFFKPFIWDGDSNIVLQMESGCSGSCIPDASDGGGMLKMVKNVDSGQVVVTDGEASTNIRTVAFGPWVSTCPTAAAGSTAGGCSPRLASDGLVVALYTKGTTTVAVLPNIRFSRFPGTRRQLAANSESGLCDLSVASGLAARETEPVRRQGAHLFASLNPERRALSGVATFPVPLNGKSKNVGDLRDNAEDTLQVVEEFGSFLVHGRVPNRGTYLLELMLEIPTKVSYYTAQGALVPAQYRGEVPGSPYRIKVDGGDDPHPAGASGSEPVCGTLYWCSVTASCVTTEADCDKTAVCPVDGDNLHGLRCGSGACVSDLSLCPVTTNCPPGLQKCWDGSCSSRSEFCPALAPCGPAPAAGDTPDLVRCPGGACVASLSLCPTLQDCPSGSFLCVDGTCAPSTSECSTANSDFVCPAQFPFRCSDGSCAYGPQGCSVDTQCPNHFPVRCADGSCQQSTEQCPLAIQSSCANSKIGTHRCPDGSCVPARSMCPAKFMCPPGQRRCWNGGCGDCPDLHNGDKCNKWDLKGKQALPMRCPGGHCTSEQCADPSEPDCPSMVEVGSMPYLNCPTHFVCPRWEPFKCSDGTCRDAASKCPSFVPCGFGTHLCPDGTCSAAQCSTPITCPPLHHLCSDKTCKAYASDCPPSVPCTAANPYRCTVSRCAQSRADCMEAEVINCNINGHAKSVRCSETTSTEKCQGSATDCKPLPLSSEDKQPSALSITIPNSESCGGLSAYLCSNGACVGRKTDCDWAACPEALPHRCDNGHCSHVRDNQTACPSEDTGCPSATPVKCKGSGGDCVADADECAGLEAAPKTCNYVSDNATISGESFPCRADEVCCGVPLCVVDSVCEQCRSATGCNGLDGNPPQGRYRCNGKCEEAAEKIRLVADRCRPKADACTDGSCPIKGSCVRTTNPQGAPAATGCNGNNKYRCGDGSCVTKITDCQYGVGCTLRCPNGQCVKTKQWCESALFTPPETVIGGKTACEGGHPNGTFPCADGTCAESAAGCPIVPYCGDYGYRCPDGTCRKEAAQCPAAKTCPSLRPIRCPHGECVRDSVECQAGAKHSFLDYTPCPDGYMMCKPNGACYPSYDFDQFEPHTYNTATNNCTDSSTDVNCKQLILHRSDDNGFWTGEGFCISRSRSMCGPGSPFVVKDLTCTNYFANVYGDKYPALGSEKKPAARSGSVGAGGVKVSYVFDGDDWHNAGNGCPVSTPEKCFSGQCVLNVTAECPLPTAPSACASNVDGSVVCVDGSCAIDAQACPAKVVCPSDAPNLCADGSCVAFGYHPVYNSNFQCKVLRPCPSWAPMRCNDRTCAVTVAECLKRKAVCPATAPARCPFMGECAQSPLDCMQSPGKSCPETQYRCADGECENSPSECSQDACDEGSHQCWDGSCRVYESLACPILPACPSDRNVRTAVGGCSKEMPSEDPAPECSGGKVPCADGVCRVDGGCGVARYDGCSALSDNRKMCPNGACIAAAAPCNTTDGFPVFSSKFPPVELFVSVFDGLNVSLSARDNRTTSRLEVPAKFSRLSRTSHAAQLLVGPVSDNMLHFITAEVPECRRDVFGRAALPYYKALVSVVVNITEPTSSDLPTREAGKQGNESWEAVHQFAKPVSLSMYVDIAEARRFFQDPPPVNGTVPTTNPDKQACKPAPYRFDPTKDLCLARMPTSYNYTNFTEDYVWENAITCSNCPGCNGCFNEQCTACPGTFYQKCPPGYRVDSIKNAVCDWPFESMPIGCRSWCVRDNRGTTGGSYSTGWPDPTPDKDGVGWAVDPGGNPAKTWECISRPTAISGDSTAKFATFDLNGDGVYAVIVSPEDTAIEVKYEVIDPMWYYVYFWTFILLALCMCCGLYYCRRLGRMRAKYKAAQKRLKDQQDLNARNFERLQAEADGEEAEMFENPLQNKKRKLREEELKRTTSALNQLKQQEVDKRRAEVEKEQAAAKIRAEQEEMDRQLERMRMAKTTKKKKKAGGKKDDDEMVEMSDLTAPPDLSPAMPPQFSEADRLAKGL